MLALQAPHTQIISYPAAPSIDSAWLRYFSPADALKAVWAHVETQPGARTPERHTARAYASGLKHFMDFAGLQLPTADLMAMYVASLTGAGLKSNTIASKYLAPVRHYLTALSDQSVIGFTGETRDFISDCKDQIRLAAKVKTPKAQTTTNVAPLWRADAIRLETAQVNAVLRSLPRPALSALRDYALLHIAFSTGLRLAELARLSLDSFTPAGDYWLATVRGKRSNIDPVPLSGAAYRDLITWVDAYNADLAPDDARRIEGDRPVWQPLTRSDRHMTPGVNRFNPDRGMSHQALRDLIAKRTRAALGDKFAIAAHDTRRTAAAIAYDKGMPIADIQQLLRHKDAATTMRYVGTKPDFGARALSTYVQFG
jgi:site-specific recombinase XerD